MNGRSVAKRIINFIKHSIYVVKRNDTGNEKLKQITQKNIYRTESNVFIFSEFLFRLILSKKKNRKQ